MFTFDCVKHDPLLCEMLSLAVHHAARRPNVHTQFG